MWRHSLPLSSDRVRLYRHLLAQKEMLSPSLEERPLRLGSPRGCGGISFERGFPSPLCLVIGAPANVDGLAGSGLNGIDINSLRGVRSVGSVGGSHLLCLLFLLVRFFICSVWFFRCGFSVSSSLSIWFDDTGGTVRGVTLVSPRASGVKVDFGWPCLNQPTVLTWKKGRESM